MNKRKQTTMIILHCSATREGQDVKASKIKKWHLNRGFSDIGYHYIVDLDGTIEKGRDESSIGAHCSGKNATSIGICYVGGCDQNLNAKDTRTKQQKAALIKIVKQMMDKYNIPIEQVYAHYQFCSYKDCPSFKIEDFKKELLSDKCPYCGH